LALSRAESEINKDPYWSKLIEQQASFENKLKWEAKIKN